MSDQVGTSTPDPVDRHVLAAAIRCGAAAIITVNLREFPHAALGSIETLAIHPDDFIMDQADLEPQLLEIVAKQQRAALKRPPLSANEFVQNLRRDELIQVAVFLDERIDLI